MINIEDLEDKFSIEGEVGFAELENDLAFITISNKYADADICLYGAHVTHFKPHRTMDILWMSPESNFQEGSPIRGGIPICFPWFGPHKTDSEKPMHGFARLMYWDVLEITTQKTGETLVRLQLCSSEKTKVYWNQEFCAEITIIIGKKLSTTLKITNTSTEAFEYSAALHSYFNLSSLENISIEGLQNTKFHDQLEQNDSIQESPVLEILKAETRHYYDTEATCTINDSIYRRRISVAKAGSKITTIWNPGEETCIAIDDMPDDAFYTFVCVEAVNAFNHTINLAPGEVHKTSTIIGIEE